jgi:hypothetical protein
MLMDLAEIKRLIAESDDTLAVLQEGLREAMATLRSEPLEVEVEAYHGNQRKTVMKPHPALRRMREIGSSMRSLELRLKKLREQEKRIILEQERAASPLAKFAPKERKRG